MRHHSRCIALAGMIGRMSDGHVRQLQLETAEDLKREIDRLFRLQTETLEHAVYMGMTPEEARTMESRRQQITALVEKLAALARKH